MTYVKVQDLKTKKVYIMAEFSLGQLFKSAVNKVQKEDVKVTKKMDRGKQAEKVKFADVKKSDKPKSPSKTSKDEPKKEKSPETAKPSSSQPEKPKEEVKEFEILETYKGSDLVGKEYTPLFPYFYEKMKPKGCFKTYAGSFVTNDAGTGIVHISPAYGEEDYNLSVKNKIIDPTDPCLTVDESGSYLPLITDFAGKNIFDCNPLIMEKLTKEGRIVKKGTIVHSYPMCWRSDSPLIYKAVKSWFINVKDSRDKLVANNEKAHWIPKPMHKLFKEWVEKAEDWCISRSRFWGNPIPLWVSEDGEEVVCVGSIAELKKLAGLPDDFKLDDLHREFVDEITIPSKEGKGTLKRIKEVFDCWFESGAMPYAHVGLPVHETMDQFKKQFPADFIGEGRDQIRGWFYTLNVLSTLLFNDTPYKNLIVNGLVLDRNGDKLSKSKKNYTDPLELVNKVGADTIRLYFMNSPLVRAEELRFKDEDLTQLVKRIFLPWYNLCKYINQEASRYKENYKRDFAYDEQLFDEKDSKVFGDVIDRWILAQQESLVKYVHQEFAQYRLYTILAEQLKFLNELSNWYVKLNKSRLKGDEGEEEATVSLNTFFHCFLKVIILMAPYVPFVTDYFYLNLKQFIKEGSPLNANSIHFLRIPQSGKRFENEDLVSSFKVFQSLVTSVRNIRDKNRVNVKQPLASITIMPRSKQIRDNLNMLKEYFSDETNILEVVLTEDDKHKEVVEFSLVPNHKLFGETLKGKYNSLKDIVMKPTPEMTAKFMKDKELLIKFQHNGVPEEQVFGEDYFSLKTTIKAKPQKENSVIDGEAEFAYELDLNIDDNLRTQGLAREMTNRIQRLRKTLKLQLTDKIYITLYFLPESVKLKKAYLERKDAIAAVVKKPLVSPNQLILRHIIGFEAFNVDTEYFIVEISKASFIYNLEKMGEVFDQSEFKEVADQLETQFQNKEDLLKNKEVEVTLKPKKGKLIVGEHVNYQV